MAWRLVHKPILLNVLYMYISVPVAFTGSDIWISSHVPICMMYGYTFY